MSHVRWDKKDEIGEAGVTYEFDIKLPRITGVAAMSNEEFEMEAEDSLRDFEAMLKKRYKWITRTYQTGRSGGWLAVVDGKGGATQAKLKTIIGLVETAQKAFIRHLRQTYPD